MVITPQQSFDMMLAIRDEVKHLSSVVDPALAQLREGQAANASRIELIVSERKAEDEKLAARIHSVETAGYVTSGRMWVAVAAISAVVTAIAAVAVLLIR